MDQVTFPIRVFKLLGVDTIVCKFEKSDYERNATGIN